MEVDPFRINFNLAIMGIPSAETRVLLPYPCDAVLG